MKLQILLIIGLFSFGFVACKKNEGCTNPTATNFDADAEKDDGSCEFAEPDATPSLVVPSTYAFTNGNGNSTVSFGGQAQRLEMLSEITTYMKTANTAGTSVDAQVLKDMYANNAYTWVDAPTLGMTGSTKNLKSKTAASVGSADPAIQAYYEGLMDDIAAASAMTTAGNNDGAAGVAGVVQSSSDPSKLYLQSANGQEYTQLIEKGLMGAVFYNQIALWYLADDQMNVDNATAVDEGAGKYYTQMEHHWDEAYGYFTTATDFPTSGTDRFWGKYASSRESVLSSATKLSEAFRTGRAAITAGDYTERDAQIAIIRVELEKVVGGTAIHYLNASLSDFSDDALRNHALSEAWAFIDGLRYGHNASVSNAQITALQTTIGNDFYNVTQGDLQSARDQLAAYLGLTDVKDIL